MSSNKDPKGSINSSSSGELPLPAEDYEFTSDSSGELPLPAIDGWGFSEDGDGGKTIDEPSASPDKKPDKPHDNPPPN